MEISLLIVCLTRLRGDKKPPAAPVFYTFISEIVFGCSEFPDTLGKRRSEPRRKFGHVDKLHRNTAADTSLRCSPAFNWVHDFLKYRNWSVAVSSELYHCNYKIRRNVLNTVLHIHFLDAVTIFFAPYFNLVIISLVIGNAIPEKCAGVRQITCKCSPRDRFIVVDIGRYEGRQKTQF